MAFLLFRTEGAPWQIGSGEDVVCGPGAHLGGQSALSGSDGQKALLWASGASGEELSCRSCYFGLAPEQVDSCDFAARFAAGF